MARAGKSITPENRLETWKKLWGSPRRLDDAETEAAFDEFVEGFVTSHMRKRFLKLFGVPKAQFGNRCFMEDASFRNWDTKFSSLGAPEGGHVEVTVFYASGESLEAHWMRGQSRRSLRDVFVDDWEAACAIARAEDATFFLFVQAKGGGCMVRVVSGDDDVMT
jgi:hypothetical protein